MVNLYGIILAGGKGERFWPKSVANHPKQLLPIISDRSMLEETIDRMSPLISSDRIMVVTGDEISAIVRHLIPSSSRVLVEPVGRNSAPAIAFATAYLLKKDPAAVMIILPADHYIPDKDLFLEAVRVAAQFASHHSYLVTFGIPPTRPETGYGYIQVDDVLQKEDHTTVFMARTFHEKPDLTTAKRFLLEGNFCWNSGMFVWSVDAIANAFRRYLPTMYRQMITLSKAIDTDDEQRATQHFFENVESISIDYGIMEKAEQVAVVSAKFRWDDVGSWASLERVYETDDQRNVVKGRCVSLDTTDSILYADDGLIATIGISNLIVVRTDDTTLVCSKDQAQKVKKILDLIH